MTGTVGAGGGGSCVGGIDFILEELGTRVLVEWRSRRTCNNAPSRSSSCVGEWGGESTSNRESSSSPLKLRASSSSSTTSTYSLGPSPTACVKVWRRKSQLRRNTLPQELHS
uniref:Uncharacterized protein n=1 Tax=Glossina austeni TaxID=7395 RepID=A0A1A9VF04_GLOAU